MTDCHVEIIDFYRPCENEKNIYITNIIARPTVGKYNLHASTEYFLDLGLGLGQEPVL